MLHLQEQDRRLNFSYARLLLEERVEANEWLQVGELRSDFRGVIGPHRNRYGRPFQMKQRVNELSSGPDLSNVSLAQQLDVSHSRVSNHQMRVDFLVNMKIVSAVNAGSGKHLKRARKRMLMDRGCAV